MNKFVDILNNDFQDILQGRKYPKYHKFFESHEWFLDTVKMWNNNSSEEKEPDYEYDEELKINIESYHKKCTFIPTKIASDEMLKNIYSVITDPKTTDFNTIRKNLYKLYDYSLPSTISDINKYLNFTNKNDINIIIAGAGPIGLFVALYLNEIYNKKSPFNTYVNILLIDNRTFEEGIKMPYSRLTQFGFDISELQPFINQIFCWKNKTMTYDTRQFDFINVLENMLYLVAYNNKIPMYFTKKYETFNRLCDFANENGFEYIFDCTGGRLKTNFKDKIEWNKYLFKKDNYEVKLCDDNIYRFFVDDELFEYITIVLSLFDENMKQFPVGNIFGFVYSENDKLLVMKYKNKCFRVEDYIKLSKKIESDNARYLYPRILKMTKINKNKVKFIKLDYFNSNSHHTNLCAKVINNDLTYIGLGDTLGNSEYGIYFGLKDNILFAKQICYLLGTFHKYRKYKTKYLDLKKEMSTVN